MPRRRPASRLARESDDPAETDDLDADARRALASEQGGGQPLPDDVRREHQQRTGLDLSDVRTHTSATAADLAAGLHARAFTSGADIFFGRDQFAPASPAGQSLLAHELSHVVQQASSAAPVVQRLMRTPFPWDGVVTATSGANLRSSPDSTDPRNVLLTLPVGAALRVTGSSGLWLMVEYTSVAGSNTAGYVHHTLVDDATAHAMGQMVGTRMRWHPSGPRPGTDFQAWAAAAAETPFPAVTTATVINCWEAVMLAGYRAGVLSWARIHAIYTSGASSGWPALMTAGSRRVFVRTGASPAPQRGDLVFFNGMDHVALATGNGTEVYSFWPAPDTPFAASGSTPDRVKIVTIDAIVAWWTANMGSGPPKVEIGAPSW